MKILFLDWPCFMKDPTFAAFKRMGHEVMKFFHKDYQNESSESFVSEFQSFCNISNPDLAFSYNYYPLLARCCNDMGMTYISFVYDSPYVNLYSRTLSYPTNHVFLFDRSWVTEFNSRGFSNVHYSVLPGDVEYVDGVIYANKKTDRAICDLSFVGNFYDDSTSFYDQFIDYASPYLKGYLEGIMAAQQKLYGASVVEPLLTDEIFNQIYNVYPVNPAEGNDEPKLYRYANYVVKRKTTQIERKRIMELIGQHAKNNRYSAKLFTVNENMRIPGIKNMGITYYETEMNQVFRNSKINLNISLRSIQTGIPLRCIDIMASGGFLLSNYQSDLCTDFVPGEDFDYYGSDEELLAKIEYYLSHDKERSEIAENGRKKIKDIYSFDNIFLNIFNTVLG